MQDTEIPGNPFPSRIETLLSQAAQLPAGERDVFLTRECGEDHALRQAVYDRLLAESRGVKVKAAGRPGPVTSAVRQALEGSAHDRRVELLGKVVGDYRLVAIVGMGGAGTVYLGERADRAYSAQVAIKVVANTQLSHEIQRRFFAERQILANLNHPYIGRLLDAGETFFDEPFLVMEYVHGEPIDRYCDNQRLGVEERLRLFLKICEAVQYAHRNLIVHRDLKPGNILVSKDGIPKLLDFGIAKLLDDSAQAILQDGAIAHTRVHDRLLTPEYASPEQIRGQPVTTTSDVYALGIVLYELLTGVRPYAVNAQNQLELERSICIQDPLKPSQMVSVLAKQVERSTADLGTTAAASSPSAGEAGESSSAAGTDTPRSLIPAARKTSFKKLEHQLKGDLDAIVMKALRKEPEKRYSSVEHLIEDLNRHLNQEPVDARQGNRWYYTQRFIKRHTVGVIAATAALLSLMAVAVILSVQAHQLKQQRDIAKAERDKATQESERAETVSNFMLDVFTAADPFQSQDKQVTAKELLDKAAHKIETTLNDQPEVKARLLEAIGEAYGDLDQIKLAIKYLEESLVLQQQIPPPDHLSIADTLLCLATNYQIQGNFLKAKDYMSRALNTLDPKDDSHSTEYLKILVDSAWLEHRQGQVAEAQKMYEHALTLSKQIYGVNHIKTANILMRLAGIFTWKADYSRAENYFRRSLSIYQEKVSDKYPDLVEAKLSLAEILIKENKLHEAKPLLIEGIENQRINFGNNNYRLIDAYNSLSELHLLERHPNMAEKDARTAITITMRNFGKLNFNVGLEQSSMTNILLKHNKFPSAEKEARKSLQVLQATAPPDHQYIASAEYLLTVALIGEYKPKEAEPMIRENIARWNRAEAPAWRSARSESLLGVALAQLHKFDEAKQHLLHADEILSAKDSGAFPDDAAIANKRVEEFQRCEKERRLNNCALTIS